MRRFVLTVFSALLFAGCGGRASNAYSSSPTGVSAGAESVGADAAAFAPAAPSSSVDVSRGGPPASSASAAEYEPDPSTRPGLATQWGERRVSYVRTTTFTRAGSRPTAIAALHYNDASGAAAQAALRNSRFEGAHVGIGSGPHRVFVSLVDEQGRALPAYHVDGRAYVVGAPGRRYSIHVTNQSPYRFEAVVSVDGLDVVDGEEASLGKRGYIVGPGDTTVIDGFRTSTSQVAAFRFGAVGSSYAAQTTGSARNVGVVGVALFGEAGVAVNLYEEAMRREHADPFPGRFAAPPPNAVAY